MSRLSNPTYLQQRQHVRDLTDSFFLLAHTDQWALHMYFVPTERITDQQLIEHRQDISTLDSSLPQRAGRAFSKLKQADKRLRVYKEQPKLPKKEGATYEIKLLSEVHPQLDPDRIAKVLLDIWKEQAGESADPSHT